MHAAEDWLSALEQSLRADFGMRAVAATEIEFYLPGSALLNDDAALITRLHGVMAEEGIGTLLPERERAPEQFEIALYPSADLVQLARLTTRLKQAVTESMRQIGLEASFAARPFADRAGSGLHVHWHLEDAAGQFLFTRDEAGVYSPALRHALAGMLDCMAGSMLHFAPSAESYHRFSTAERSPTRICWGPNNRTAALRLPNRPLNAKTIEHRVPGADADPAAAMAAMLVGIMHGLHHRLEPPEAVHGEAHRYELPLLPTTLEEAQAIYSVKGGIK